MIVGKKPKVRPTEKQKLFVANKLKGMSARQAALKAGYSPYTAKNVGTDILAKPGTREALLDAMRKAGINEEYLTDMLRDGTRATKALVIDGNIEYVDDMPTRHRYLDTILEIGQIKVKLVDHTTKGEPLQVIFGNED